MGIHLRTNLCSWPLKALFLAIAFISLHSEARMGFVGAGMLGQNYAYLKTKFGNTVRSDLDTNATDANSTTNPANSTTANTTTNNTIPSNQTETEPPVDKKDKIDPSFTTAFIKSLALIFFCEFGDRVIRYSLIMIDVLYVCDICL